MAEVLLFHHAQGQTAGFGAFADELRRAGHAVHAPDLYDGHTFATLDEDEGPCCSTPVCPRRRSGRPGRRTCRPCTRRVGPSTPSCSSTTVSSITSPTPACLPTTRTQLHC